MTAAESGLFPNGVLTAPKSQRDPREGSASGQKAYIRESLADSDFSRIHRKFPDIAAALAAGLAVLPDVLEGEAYLRYLEALDERIIKEVLIRLGENGNTNLRIVGLETTQDERNQMNFPRYKMRETLVDYIDIE